MVGYENVCGQKLRLLKQVNEVRYAHTYGLYGIRFAIHKMAPTTRRGPNFGATAIPTTTGLEPKLCVLYEFYSQWFLIIL